MTVNRSTPYFRFGAPALYEKLGALPSRYQTRPPFAIDPPTKERIEIECGIIDDWATDLFGYCRSRPPFDRRFHAMLFDAQVHLDPNDAFLRIGLYPTWEACLHLKQWLMSATRLPHDRP